MQVAIAGGTGFLGRQLTQRLVGLGHKVLWISRDPQTQTPESVSVCGYEDLNQIPVPECVINLAGAGIMDWPWTSSRRKQIKQSRFEPTEYLVDWIRHRKTKDSKGPVFISGSAIGFYGGGADVVDEMSPKGSGFASDLCAQWESIAREAKPYVSHFYIIRTSVVLGSEGGLLARLEPQFRAGLGASLGSGDQRMSWISINDWVSAVLFLIENTPADDAIYNLASPVSVTNKEFTQALANALDKKARLHVPALPMRLLMGDMTKLILDNFDCAPQALLDHGFEFNEAQIDSALQSIFYHNHESEHLAKNTSDAA